MAEPRSGERFAGRYDIEAPLGEGGMGVVWAARHAFTDRPVAIKVLHEFVAASKTARERFLREARAPSAVGHPSLIEVLDAGDEDGTLYLVMDRLEGGDLGEALEEGTIGAERLVSVALELLDALEAAHRAGLVHRDIKPENIFLLREPQGGASIKLLDFGITQLREPGGGDQRLTATGAVMGTPLFMSPEQASGEEVDGRSDLWSVGAILYLGLVGEPHFDATNYNLVITKILTETPPSLRSRRPDLPAELIELVDRALTVDRRRRWPDAASMRVALATCPPIDASGEALVPTKQIALPDGQVTGPMEGSAPALSSSPSTPAPSPISYTPASHTGPLLAAGPPPAPMAQPVEAKMGGEQKMLIAIVVGTVAFVLLLFAAIAGFGAWMYFRVGGDREVGVETLPSPPPPSPRPPTRDEPRDEPSPPEREPGRWPRRPRATGTAEDGIPSPCERTCSQQNIQCFGRMQGSNNTIAELRRCGRERRACLARCAD